jgi:hypothetical protein
MPWPVAVVAVVVSDDEAVRPAPCSRDWAEESGTFVRVFSRSFVP